MLYFWWHNCNLFVPPSYYCKIPKFEYQKGSQLLTVVLINLLWIYVKRLFFVTFESKLKTRTNLFPTLSLLIKELFPLQVIKKKVFETVLWTRTFVSLCAYNSKKHLDISFVLLEKLMWKKRMVNVNVSCVKKEIKTITSNTNSILFRSKK